jgi:YD repeat-containing protein
VKSVAGIDHFGRKTFDELQLGTGILGRTYEYESGDCDREKLNGKLKSIPETDLVNKITYYNGKELRYTYNEAGDITQVRDENGNLLEAYSYDELGRLKTEQNVKGQYYTAYEYDAGGNSTTNKEFSVKNIVA